jgi:hypothetical protein
MQVPISSVAGFLLTLFTCTASAATTAYECNYLQSLHRSPTSTRKDYGPSVASSLSFIWLRTSSHCASDSYTNST